MHLIGEPRRNHLQTTYRNILDCRHHRMRTLLLVKSNEEVDPEDIHLDRRLLKIPHRRRKFTMNARLPTSQNLSS